MNAPPISNSVTIADLDKRSNTLRARRLGWIDVPSMETTNKGERRGSPQDRAGLQWKLSKTAAVEVVAAISKGRSGRKRKERCPARRK
jgi:hypothetical protein